MASESIREWFHRELAAAIADGRIQPGREDSDGVRALARKILGPNAKQGQIKAKARRLRGIGVRPRQKTVDEIAAALGIQPPTVPKGGLEALIAVLEARVAALEDELVEPRPGQAAPPSAGSEP